MILIQMRGMTPEQEAILGDLLVDQLGQLVVDDYMIESIPSVVVGPGGASRCYLRVLADTATPIEKTKEVLQQLASAGHHIIFSSLGVYVPAAAPEADPVIDESHLEAAGSPANAADLPQPTHEVSYDQPQLPGLDIEVPAEPNFVLVGEPAEVQPLHA